ncbi:MAG: DNA replication/repair protein RecF [Gammaproteobacteria bacterium]|nr:DNA replication/repair protein RecF [Gammaproteobacteria bacterium]MDE0364691.1 DNA replication/repair protein RecF [Gammaproteobacteria bacterium]
MIINELQVLHVRNLTSVSINPNQQFNYLYGENGAGKTALLEAVHLLARGRSFRGRRIAPIIQTGERSLLVRAELADGHSLGISRDRSGKTELHVDRAEARRLSDAAALLPVHLILPDVSQLIFGGPGERRQCLDWGMFHVKQGYLSAHRKYLAALRQRNAILKSWNEAGSRAAIDAWTETVCREAETVHDYRCEYVSGLIPHFQAALAGLEAGFAIELAYKSGWGEEELAKVLGDSLDNDVKLGSTGAGPHRADLSLKVADRDAGVTLSRGQGKLVAIGLILAQAQLLKDRTGQRSVFLIDDLGAELDGAHGARMLTLLRSSGCQVISTSTRPPSEEFVALFGRGNFAMFHVKQGQINAVA